MKLNAWHICKVYRDFYLYLLQFCCFEGRKIPLIGQMFMNILAKTRPLDEC